MTRPATPAFSGEAFRDQLVADARTVANTRNSRAKPRWVVDTRSGSW